MLCLETLQPDLAFAALQSRGDGLRPRQQGLGVPAAKDGKFPMRHKPLVGVLAHRLQHGEPWLTSALRTVERAVDDIEHHGISPERIVILGFSQGGCLGLEFAARHARRYAGVVGLSAGLIGPPGPPRAYGGSLDGTPVLLGCSDIDPHIPLQRVHESADVFRRLGALVDERVYPDMGHNVNDDEIEAVRILLQQR